MEVLTITALVGLVALLLSVLSMDSNVLTPAQSVRAEDEAQEDWALSQSADDCDKYWDPPDDTY